MAKLIDIIGKPLSGEWGTDDLDGTGIPVLRTTNFTNEGVVDYRDVVTRQITKKNLAEKMLCYGDIILEKSGGSDKQPVGRVIFFEGEENKYLFNNFTGLLRVKDTTKWMPKYVFYALFANYVMGGTLRYENKTTGLHNLQTDAYVAAVNIPDYSIEKQEEIVSCLDGVIGLMGKQRQQLAKLDELVKSRFVEMFGAVSADKCTKRIKDYAEVLGGYAFKSDLFCSDSVPVIRISNINNGRVELDYSICFDKLFWKQNKRFRVERNDILMAMSGATTGKAGIYKDNSPALINQRVACIRAKNGIALPQFLFVATQLEWMYDLIQKTSAGCAQPNISGKQIENMPMPNATYEQQQQFTAFVVQVNKSKVVVQKALDEAQLLFDSLMQEYFG